MKNFTAEASFWLAVALAGVAGVYLVKLLAGTSLGDQLPAFRNFAVSL